MNGGKDGKHHKQDNDKNSGSGAWRTQRGAASVFNMPQLTAGERLLALDCEMCRTAAGLEVTRVSVVDSAGEVRLFVATLVSSRHDVHII